MSQHSFELDRIDKFKASRRRSLFYAVGEQRVTAEALRSSSENGPSFKIRGRLAHRVMAEVPRSSSKNGRSFYAVGRSSR